jgi:hypothetical protein
MTIEERKEPVQLFPSLTKSDTKAELIELTEFDMHLDLSPAMTMGQIVGINEELIRVHLAHKIRAHKQAFLIPRQAALIPFWSKYFGIFSWRDNIITCHSIFSLPVDANPEMWESWSRMLLSYNDAYASKHRIIGASFSVYDLKRTLTNIQSGVDQVQAHIKKFQNKDSSEIQLTLRQAQQTLQKIEHEIQSESTGNLNILAADLEMALSYLHDLIDSLRPEISFIN